MKRIHEIFTHKEWLTLIRAKENMRKVYGKVTWHSFIMILAEQSR